MFVFLRFIIGLIFLVSGLGKVLEPYQNFLYAIQAYQLLPSWAETAVALVFPWLEVVVGVFVLLGLWMPWCLRVALAMYCVFVVVVGQALMRGLPLEHCGCFGEWVHLKPQSIIVADSFCLLLILALLIRLPQTKKLSLDSYFEKA